jgi:hypothetical protein
VTDNNGNVPLHHACASHPVFGGNDFLFAWRRQFYQFITVQVLQQTAREGSLLHELSSTPAFVWMIQGNSRVVRIQSYLDEILHSFECGNLAYIIVHPDVT